MAREEEALGPLRGQPADLSITRTIRSSKSGTNWANAYFGQTGLEFDLGISHNSIVKGESTLPAFPNTFGRQAGKGSEVEKTVSRVTSFPATN